MIRNVTFSITNRCNSHCKICNIWKISDFSDELSLPEIKGLLAEPYFKDLDTVSITGGEPMLRKDLAEIIRLIKTQRPKVRRIFLNTNATLINKTLEICTLCTSLFEETILSISLDGRPHIHNALRGMENYENVISLLEKASKIPHLKISLSMTLSNKNCTLVDLTHVHNLARQYNVMFSFRFADNSETYYRNENIKFAVSETKKQLVSRFIKKHCQDNEFLQVLDRYIETDEIPFLIDKKGHNCCLAGKEFAFIHPNGKVSPCLYSTQTIDISGNINKKIKLGTHEKCPCCTDCAIYPILEHQKGVTKC